MQPLLLGFAGLIAYCLHDIGEDLPPKGTAVAMCAPAPCNPCIQAATIYHVCRQRTIAWRARHCLLQPYVLRRHTPICESRCAMALVAAATWPLAQKKGKKN